MMRTMWSRSPVTASWNTCYRRHNNVRRKVEKHGMRAVPPKKCRESRVEWAVFCYTFQHSGKERGLCQVGAKAWPVPLPIWKSI